VTDPESCQTDLLCTWRNNGKLSVSLRQPIPCAYRWTRDSLLKFRLKISLSQLTDNWWSYYIYSTTNIVVFYGLQNFDREFRCTYVQFIVIVPGVRSSLPIINKLNGLSLWLVKVVSSFPKFRPSMTFTNTVLVLFKLAVDKITFTRCWWWMNERVRKSGGMISTC